MPAGAARADTATYGYTGGEQAFTVPAGVSSIQVVAVGGRGGRGGTYQGGPPTVAGGFGARQTATISVTPGQVLYVEVGGNGANGNGSLYSAGGFNGGGMGGPTETNPTGAGAGGGASDVRTKPRSAGDSLQSRLVIAAGGGGGGGGQMGGAGGARGAAGGNGYAFNTDCKGGGGGKQGQCFSGGAAGSHSDKLDAPKPTAGVLGA
ncbi:MAG: hypothetical protein ICV73_28105, partial [Acetobacteraceae bacterium]|nr:hypothetical protein [Acetobacteraceae bacterium]